jgi:hypothetical protein
VQADSRKPELLEVDGERREIKEGEILESDMDRRLAG